MGRSRKGCGRGRKGTAGMLGCEMAVQKDRRVVWWEGCARVVRLLRCVCGVLWERCGSGVEVMWTCASHE